MCTLDCRSCLCIQLVFTNDTQIRSWGPPVRGRRFGVDAQGLSSYVFRAGMNAFSGRWLRPRSREARQFVW